MGVPTEATRIAELEDLLRNEQNKNAGLIQQAALNTQRITNLTAELNVTYAASRGEVWYWQKDEDNHLSTLNCFIQIHAVDLKELIGFNKAITDTQLNKAQRDHLLSLVANYAALRVKQADPSHRHGSCNYAVHEAHKALNAYIGNVSVQNKLGSKG